MNIIECSPLRDAEGQIGIAGILNGILEYGFNWRKLVQAQDHVVHRIQKVLSGDHILYRDVVLPGINPKQPVMVLFSPQGIRILLAFPLRGIYRAKGAEWLVFDEGARRFKKTRPNLQEQGGQITRVVRQVLEAAGLSFIEMETVLLFTNARTLVDTARPRVRVVPADAIDYFASSIQQLPAIFQKDDLLALTNTLNEILFPEPEEEVVEEEIVFDESELVDLSSYGPEPFTHVEPEPSPAPFISEQETDFDTEAYDEEEWPEMVEDIEYEEEDPAEQKGLFARIGFSRKQWLTLGLLGIVEILILGAFAYLIVKYAYLFL